MRFTAASVVLCALFVFGCDGDSTNNPGEPTDGVDWVRTIGSVRDDQAYGLDVSNGAIFLATTQENSGVDRDVVVYRMDTTGSSLWQERWGGAFADDAFAVKEANGIVYVAGSTQTNASLGSAKAFLLALEASNGELIWSFTRDAGPGFDRYDGVTIDGNDIYLSGRTENPDMDMLVTRLGLDGSHLWTQSTGTRGWDAANGTPVVLNGLLYVAGRWNADNVSSGGLAALVAFSTTSGIEAWHQPEGEAGRTTGAFDLASDGFNLYMVGAASNGARTQVQLWSFSPGGFLQWQREWGGSGSEFGYGITVDQFTGSLLATGQTTSFGNGGSDLFLLSCDRTGAFQDTLFWGGTGFEAGEKVVAATDAIYVAGETESYGQGGTDAVVLRIR